MKNEITDHFNLAPREERAILDEIRNDHELIKRLNITPQELEALSKCALFGTLTCKQDMLFILRQIREATSPGIDHANLLPAPVPAEDEVEEDQAVDLRSVRGRITPAIGMEPGSFDGIVKRHMHEHWGILFWVSMLAVALVWNGVIVITRWRDGFMTNIGTPLTEMSSSDAWYAHMDKFSLLLTWEVIFVALIIAVIYYRSERNSRRYKVRPGGR
jgi:hypothetical protein